MKPIEGTLRKLSELYEFNRKLQAFSIGKEPREVGQAVGPTVVVVKKAK